MYLFIFYPNQQIYSESLRSYNFFLTVFLSVVITIDIKNYAELTSASAKILCTKCNQVLEKKFAIGWLSVGSL